MSYVTLTWLHGRSHQRHCRALQPSGATKELRQVTDDDLSRCMSLHLLIHELTWCFYVDPVDSWMVQWGLIMLQWRLKKVVKSPFMANLWVIPTDNRQEYLRHTIGMNTSQLHNDDAKQQRMMLLAWLWIVTLTCLDLLGTQPMGNRHKSKRLGLATPQPGW